jgi:hypothetical protein
MATTPDSALLIDVKALLAQTRLHGADAVPATTAADRFTSARVVVKSGVAGVENSGQITGRQANQLVTGQPTLRFAVAAFDTWSDAREALHVLNAGGKVLDDVSYLALEHVFAAASDGKPMVHLFGAGDDAIGCSAGPIAERLSARRASGAQSLQAALAGWLIARHAAHMQQIVEDGKIVLWVQLFDNDDERRAYRSLLATSSNSVGVHDLVGG